MSSIASEKKLKQDLHCDLLLFLHQYFKIIDKQKLDFQKQRGPRKRM
jgi:hypothetical protein